MLKVAPRRVFSDLQTLLHWNGSQENLWDMLFAMTFLCLVVVGKTQASVLQRPEVHLLFADPRYNSQDARNDFEEMEEELSVHLIGMFHLRCGTIRRYEKGFDPLAHDPQDRP